jgi:hypothetical protein
VISLKIVAKPSSEEYQLAYEKRINTASNSEYCEQGSFYSYIGKEE